MARYRVKSSIKPWTSPTFDIYHPFLSIRFYFSLLSDFVRKTLFQWPVNKAFQYRFFSFFNIITIAIIIVTNETTTINKSENNKKKKMSSYEVNIKETFWLIWRFCKLRFIRQKSVNRGSDVPFRHR